MSPNYLSSLSTYVLLVMFGLIECKYFEYVFEQVFDTFFAFLQNDPLIFHYTSGKCKNKYGADERPFPNIQGIRACFLCCVLLALPLLILMAPVAFSYAAYIFVNKKHFM